MARMMKAAVLTSEKQINIKQLAVTELKAGELRYKLYWFCLQRCLRGIFCRQVKFWLSAISDEKGRILRRIFHFNRGKFN